MGESKSTQVKTGLVRISFAHLFEPYASNEGYKEKYSCTALVPKSDKETLAKIQVAVNAAKEEGKASKWKGKIPPGVALTVYDGDGTTPKTGEEWGSECKGHYVVRCSALLKPPVLDLYGNQITDPTQVVSGDYCRLLLNFYPYNTNGNGVSAGLNAIQFVKKGEPLSGGFETMAKNEFNDGFKLEELEDSLFGNNDSLLG